MATATVKYGAPTVDAIVVTMSIAEAQKLVRFCDYHSDPAYYGCGPVTSAVRNAITRSGNRVTDPTQVVTRSGNRVC